MVCWGLFLLLVTCQSFTVLAAQMVDRLPSELKNNWQYCLQFESRQKVCESVDLDGKPWWEKTPLDQQEVVYQIYRKEIIINNLLGYSPLGLAFDSIDDVDEVYLNGQFVGRTGRFLPDFESGFGHKRVYLLPMELIKFNQFNLIEIRAFSSQSRPGLAAHPPVLGDYLQLIQQRNRENYVYVIGATGIAFLAILQLFYFLAIKNNPEAAFSSSFFASAFIFTLTRSSIPREIGFDLSAVYKLENTMLSLMVISAMLLAVKFFNLERKTSTRVGLAFLGASMLLVILWPFALSLRAVAEINFAVIFLAGLIILVRTFIRAIHKQRAYWRIMLATYCCGWLLLSYDMLSRSTLGYYLNLGNIPYLFPVGLVVLGFIFSLVLTHKSWRFSSSVLNDKSTGELTRSLFFLRFDQEIQRATLNQTGFLVALVDIEQAKEIAENYGDSVINHLMQQVAQTIRSNIQSFDLLCRINDEQFCLACSFARLDEAQALLVKLYSELKQRLSIEGETSLPVENYIGGVVFSPSVHLTSQHLIQDVNYALSKAKNQARHVFLLNQWVNFGDS